MTSHTHHHDHPTPPLHALHSSLTALGAPSLSLDDLSRLCHGPLGDALYFLFLEKRIRGRQGVNAARGYIQRCGKEEVGAAPGVNSRSHVEKASSRLAAAKKTIHTYEHLLDEQQSSLAEAQDEVEQLRATLDKKRHVLELLSVLEKKESIRVNRIQEVKTLLSHGDPRKSMALQGGPSIVVSEFTSTPLDEPPCIPSISHTKDALACLHAHHLRLSHMTSKSAIDRSEGEVGRRLRRSIARSMNLTEEDERTTLFQEKLDKLARLRARQSACCHSSVAVHKSSLDLKKVHQANNVKERELQKASDLSIALLFASELLVRSISTFTTTSADLLSFLRDKAPQANGYIDLFQTHISKSIDEREGSASNTFCKEVKSACGLRGNVTGHRILDALEEYIHTAHEREAFRDNSQLAIPLAADPEQDRIISRHEANQQSAYNDAMEVLQHQTEKFTTGWAQVEEIETLLKEVDLIVGGSLGQDRRRRNV